MDQATLVDSLKVDGKRLLDRLAEDGIAVAACWLRGTEEGQWFLYIATPLVNEEGATMAAYRRVNAVMREMPSPFSINPLEVRVVSSGSPLAKAVEELFRRYNGRIPTRAGGGQFGGLSIDDSYVYPPITATVP